MASSTKEKLFEGAIQLTAVNKFAVTVTEAGSNTDIPCTDLRDFSSSISVWGDGWLRCEASLSEYRFNPISNRFLKAYLVGYVEGQDNNENTPTVSGGVCTKIN